MEALTLIVSLIIVAGVVLALFIDIKHWEDSNDI